MSIISYIKIIKNLYSEYANKQEPWVDTDFWVKFNGRLLETFNNETIKRFGYDPTLHLFNRYCHYSALAEHQLPEIGLNKVSNKRRAVKHNDRDFVYSSSYAEYIKQNMLNHLLSTEYFGLSDGTKSKIVENYYDTKFNLYFKDLCDRSNIFDAYKSKIYDELVNSVLVKYNAVGKSLFSFSDNYREHIQSEINALPNLKDPNLLSTVDQKIEKKLAQEFHNYFNNQKLSNVVFSKTLGIDVIVSDFIFDHLNRMYKFLYITYDLPNEAHYIWLTGNKCAYEDELLHSKLNGMTCKVGDSTVYKKCLNYRWVIKRQKLGIVNDSHPGFEPQCDCYAKTIYRDLPRDGEVRTIHDDGHIVSARNILKTLY